MFIHSLIHSSTQKLFIEHLLHARQYPKGQRYQIEKKKVTHTYTKQNLDSK